MKGKGLAQILVSIAVIACAVYFAIAGFGASKTGSISDVKLGLDLAGGVSITYQTVKEDPSESEVDDTKYKMRLRADSLSTESAVYLEGDRRITVDIPDVKNADDVLEQLGAAGNIYFIYAKGPDGEVNIELDTVNSTADEKKYKLTKPLSEIIAAGDVVVDGSQIVGAQPQSYQDALGTHYIVELSLNDSGKANFATATKYAAQYYSGGGGYLENIIAIVYDNEVIQAPYVQNEITGGSAMISGQANFEESKTLASIIRIGALPLELEVLKYNVVGAKLGSDAIRSSLIAGAIGLALVIIFMICWYRIPGLAASIALIFYVAMMIFCLNIFDVTMTLPGIAGIILSIGMAVDANVIIFTRIQEELAAGKTVRSSIKSGFSKALSAIIDGNVTTLIAAAVLYLLGVGTIKGFAETLAIGIVLSMITALFVTKFILLGFFNLGATSIKCYGVKNEKKPLPFVKNFKKFAIGSGAVIAIGIVAIIINAVSSGNAFNYGLDFKGGTMTEISFESEMPDTLQADLEKDVYDCVGVAPEIAISRESHTATIKTEEMLPEARKQMTDMLISKYDIDESLIATDTISPTVSGEMKRSALIAVIVAAICMLIYIWIRFKNFNFATSAVIALIHDVLVVITVYAVFSKFLSVGNTFIACLLTIVGYSINATIVIFDRIRENMKERLKKETVEDVVNNSITQTMSRSINSSLTTLFTVIMIAILGATSVREFAIPLIVGIICGGYSSICITGGLWYRMQKKKNNNMTI